ncbi:hypothetical protein BU17DRAFT_87508 [Hysterangium stoloniferum]|nr:hypothetical protein BU17DRAFT_87508 [Hysterangium stoloniferum]
MPQKSKAAQSHIKNLGSKAQKKPSVTIKDVPDDNDFNCKPVSLNLDQSNEKMYEEAFIVDEEDGSLTLVGFLDDFEEEPLPDLAHDLDSDDENDENPRDYYLEIQELSEGTDLFEDGVVSMLCNAIVLWSVVYGTHHLDQDAASLLTH